MYSSLSLSVRDDDVFKLQSNITTHNMSSTEFLHICVHVQTLHEDVTMVLHYQSNSKDGYEMRISMQI